MYSSRSHESAERDRKTETERDTERSHSKPFTNGPSADTKEDGVGGIVILEFLMISSKMNLRLSNR